MHNRRWVSIKCHRTGWAAAGLCEYLQQSKQMMYVWNIYRSSHFDNDLEWVFNWSQPDNQLISIQLLAHARACRLFSVHRMVITSCIRCDLAMIIMIDVWLRAASRQNVRQCKSTGIYVSIWSCTCNRSDRGMFPNYKSNRLSGFLHIFP